MNKQQYTRPTATALRLFIEGHIMAPSVGFNDDPTPIADSPEKSHLDDEWVEE